MRALGLWRRARLGSTPVRTFVVYPAAHWLLEAVRQQRAPSLDARGLPLLAWGYLQYRLCGQYRRTRGGGGPGPAVPPERLVTSGPYAVVRNPMYLGHLIFLVGLTLALRSWAAALLTLAVAGWFHRRVLDDEARLRARFGDEYVAYLQRVPRWLPRLWHSA